MGCWDIYCLACGLPCHSETEYIEIAEETGDNHLIRETKNLLKKINYLNKNTFLTVDDRIIHNCKEISCNIQFVSPNKEKFIQIGYNNFGNDQMRGIFIHTSCWKWIYDTYDIKLKYSDLPINIMHNTRRKIVDEPIAGINFGPVTKYWNQFFDYISMIKNNDQYMIDRNDSKNVSRMKKIMSQYKIKNNPKRVGPSPSATFFKNGDIKLGNNKLFWIKKNGKWQEIKENTLAKKYIIKNPGKQILKYINDIHFIGEFNRKPIFLLEFKQNKKDFLIDIVTTQKELISIDRMLIKN